jgi:hypothetical protein
MDRLQHVIALIDAANGRDPTMIGTADGPRPAEQAYGERMSARLDVFRPGAGDLVKIACRAQHLERWRLPRSDYPMDRPGYHRWRTEQKRRHAARLEQLMAKAGYDAGQAERAAALVRKENLRTDPDAQTLEDVACLVFLEHYAEDFAAGRDPDKLVAIVRKTWDKMSQEGRAAALRLDLPEAVGDLVNRALSPP